MRAAIIQSNYIPWKGYFDLLGQVDVFVFYDDVQFTKNDWRNRNKIKYPDGSRWLSIPCGQSLDRLVCEVRVDQNPWRDKHWRSIENCYSKAKFWGAYRDFLYDFYSKEWIYLSDLNQSFIRWASEEIFGFSTEFLDSRSLNVKGDRTKRLVDILTSIGAKTYLSGPSAKNYIVESLFAEAGIAVEWMSYEGYPEYDQLHPPFVHEVSVLDLILNTGPEAVRYLSRGKRPAGS